MLLRFATLVLPMVTVTDSNSTSTTNDPRTSRSGSTRAGDGDHGCRVLQARTGQQGPESDEARKASSSNRFDAHASGKQEQEGDGARALMLPLTALGVSRLGSSHFAIQHQHQCRAQARIRSLSAS